MFIKLNDINDNRVDFQSVDSWNVTCDSDDDGDFEMCVTYRNREAESFSF
jgi:hypothetical protein